MAEPVVPAPKAKFDPVAWVKTEPAKRIRSGGHCSICEHTEAARAVRTIVELWIKGAAVNWTRIAEEVLIDAFGFGAPTGQTVSRHVKRCEPKLWERLRASQEE